MTRLSDTTPEAERVLAEAFRAMSPGRKWGILAREYRCARSLHEAGYRRRNPGATDLDIRRDWVRMMVGPTPGGGDGGRTLNGDDENFEVLREVVATFDRLGVAYVLGGSYASGLHGTPRQTRDADLSVDPFPGREAEFVAGFGPDYYVSEDAVERANRERSSFNVIQTAVGFKVDVFVRKDRPFEQSLMERRQPVPFPGMGERPIQVVTPEDVVLLKLEWYRLGQETSDRQWSDVLGVLRVQGDRIDGAYLDRWAAELGVGDLLERARGEVGP